MVDSIPILLAGIVVVGIAAQWLSWRLRLPSILILLLAGFVAGPLTGALDPDALLGDLLLPFVSLSVAVILFEGGLTLRFGELKRIGPAVRNLVSIGALVTWALTATAAWALLGLPPSLAVLLGAILIVTGPTVIAPLLRQVKPRPPVGPLLKWEGILIDPVGATVAVLVFEAIDAATPADRMGGLALFGLLRTVVFGGGLGVAGAWLLAGLLRRFWVPDYLHNTVSLAVVLAVFTAANALQHESGLLAVTAMGVLLANQKSVNVRHILEFKENLQVLLISTLFILLAARIDLEQVRRIGAGHVAFLAALVLVIRPAAVWLSTMRSGLSWRERLFVAWVAPRGIVAAAVVSVFSLRLLATGHHEQAARLVPLTFMVIVVTITLAGLTAAPLARRLGLAVAAPQGVLLVGAHTWARAIAEALRGLSIDVILVDTNRANVMAARMQGLEAHYGNILADHTIDELAWERIGKCLALTPNDEANALGIRHVRHLLGRAATYQLAPRTSGDTARENMPPHAAAGRLLFGPAITFDSLTRRFGEGQTVKAVKLTEAFDGAAFTDRHGASALPLFAVDELGRLNVWTSGQQGPAQVGQTLVALVAAGEGGTEGGEGGQ